MCGGSTSKRPSRDFSTDTPVGFPPPPWANIAGGWAGPSRSSCAGWRIRELCLPVAASTREGRQPAAPRDGLPSSPGPARLRPSGPVPARPDGIALEYPLRPDLLAQVVVPRDLTVEEAHRMGAFLVTLAVDFRPSSIGERHSPAP